MVKYEKIESDGKLPIKLIRFINDLNGPIEKHWHNSIEIVVPLSGKGSAWINGKTYDYVGMNLNEGGHDIFIVNSKSIHSFESYKEDIPYYGYVLQINYDFLKTVYFQIDQINFIQHPGHQISRKVKQMIWELDETYQCQSEYKNALIMSKIYEIIFYLLENSTSSKENCVENKSEKNKKRITEIVNYIGQHYQDDLCIQDIANHFSISNNHLSKLFKENLNITVKTYLTSVRIKYVKKDLLETDLPLIDIAISNGFPNLKSLNREMEKACNMTASKYRKTVKKVKNM